MSGLSRTPGKRVWVNSPPRVRIPPAPPGNLFSSKLKTRDPHSNLNGGFFVFWRIFLRHFKRLKITMKKATRRWPIVGFEKT